MPSKKTNDKKAPDTAGSKKRASEDTGASPKLNIQKRSIIVQEINDSEEDTDSDTQQFNARREAKTIEPSADLKPTKPEPQQKPADEKKQETADDAKTDSGKKASDDDKASEKPEKTDEASSKTNGQHQDASKKSEQNKPDEETPDASKQESGPEKTDDTKQTEAPAGSQESPKNAKQEDEPEITPEKTEPDTGGVVTELQGPGKKTSDMSPQPQKQKSTEDIKQEKQIEGYIDKREFFVPINSVARKRSIKRSLILTLLELILGIFLINLMLDAGLIQLLEKVPHTNFFSLH